MNRNKRSCEKLQNMKNLIKKKLIPSLLVGLIVLSSFGFAFASTLDLSQYYDHSSQYNAVGSYSFSENILTLTCTTSGSSPDYSVYMFPLSSGDSISFTCDYDLNSYGSSKNFFGLQSPSGGSLTVDTLTKNGNYYYSSTKSGTFNASCSITNTNTFCFMMKSSGTSTFKIYNLIINNVPIDVSEQGYTSLENGNIVYFDIGSGKSLNIDIESYFYSKSGVVSGIWADDNRRYGFSDSLPTANTTIGESSGTALSFSKSTKGQNLLGQTHYGDSNISGTSSGRYLWIINPMYNNKYFEDSLSAEAINGLMSIYGVPGGTIVYTYKLKQNASNIGLDSDIPSVSGGVGSIATGSGIQTQFVSTEDNTQSYTQTVGGDNSAPEEVSAVEGIRQTLDQFVNGFMNLFTAPISHIQQLISSGSSFIQTLGGLFAWLPSPVTNVLTSALILFIVIGVLKMLL